MTTYSDADTLRVALGKYFIDNGFAADGGYSDAWVKIKVGPIPFLIPNGAARKRVVPHHDLHHIATGYSTSFRGEAEIGAWEVASSCERFYVAWLLNLLAMSLGLLFWPGDIYEAFMRGRYTRNTYRMEYGGALLDTKVGELRASLGLDRSTAAASPQDRWSFVGWACVSLSLGLVALVLYAAPLVAAMWLVFALI